MEFSYALKVLKKAGKDPVKNPGKVSLLHVVKDDTTKLNLGETLLGVKEYSEELNEEFLSKWISELPDEVTETIESLKGLKIS